MRGCRTNQRRIVRWAVAAAVLGCLTTACTSTTGGEASTGGSTAPATGGTERSSSTGNSSGPPAQPSGGPSSGGSSGSSGTASSGSVVTARMQLADGGQPPSADQLAAAAQVMMKRVADIPGVTIVTTEPDLLTITAPGDDEGLLEPVAVQGDLLARPVTATAPEGNKKYSAPTPDSADAATVEAWRTKAVTALQSGGVSCDGLPVPEPVAADLPLLACDREQDNVYLLEASLFDPGFVDNAEAAASATAGGWTITLTFGEAAAQDWSVYTKDHIGAQVAFIVDDEVISAPIINSPIATPETQISGAFTDDEAKALATALNSGSLGLDVIDVEVTTG